MDVDRMSPLDASFLHIEDSVSHMHIASVSIFEGPAPPFRDIVGDDPRQAAPRPPLPADRPLRAARARPPGVGRRPALQHRLPPPPHRPPRTRAARPSSRSWWAGSCPSSSTAPGPCGRSGWSRGSRTGAGPCSPRPTTPWSTGSPGPTCWPPSWTSRPTPRPAEPDAWRPRPGADRGPAGRRVGASTCCAAPTSRSGRVRAGTRVPAPGRCMQAEEVARGSRHGRPGPAARRSPASTVRSGPTAATPGRRPSVDDIKAVRKGLGGTFNDVVLAAITHGFRELLLARGSRSTGWSAPWCRCRCGPAT